MLTQINSANALIVGASQGIGLGFVRSLLQQNHFSNIYATYRNRETAAELFKLEQQYGDRLTCLQVDITIESDIIAAVKQIHC